MAGKKKSNKVPEHEDEHQEEGQTTQEEEPDRYRQMEARLEKTIDSRLARFEKAMEHFLAAAEPSPPKKKATKRSAPPPEDDHDTRNKALRSKYNPQKDTPSDSLIENNDEMNIQEYDSPAKGKDQHAPRQPSGPPRSHQPSSVNKDGGAHTQSLSPQRQQFTNKLEMNKWLIQDGSFAAGNQRMSVHPMSARVFYNDDNLDAHVQNIIASSASTIAHGNVKMGFFPSKYVLRGHEKKRATINSLTISEHCWGIFRMIHDEEVQADIKPNLLIHIEQILEDTQEYDWQTAVRPWSIKVFSRIAEGRIFGGWSAKTEIQNLRMMIVQASTAKIDNRDNRDTTQANRPHFSAQSSEQLRGGHPCVNYNSQKGCTLPSGHLHNGKKLIHICAFCLFDSAAARPHPEFYCRNKQRQNTNQYFQT